jgi:hypothetical protein
MKRLMISLIFESSNVCMTYRTEKFEAILKRATIVIEKTRAAVVAIVEAAREAMCVNEDLSNPW